MLASPENLGGRFSGGSVRGLKWVVRNKDERVISNLAQKLSIPEILAIILYNRGIDGVDSASDFLYPKLRNLLPNPFTLNDMPKAVSRIVDAINRGEKITVFGDYDVDGATSSALLKKYFRSLGVEINVYIPNRIEEGYGPSIEGFNRIIEDGSTLIITVDCGALSFEPIAHAKRKGVDVIVVDHHLSLENLPEAVAVINPNRMDETFEYKSLAAVGVAYMLIVALNSQLKNEEYFEKKGIEQPNLLLYLDLVALGTVCDVMPLTAINRAFVTQGLKLINSRSNTGIAALLEVAKVSGNTHSYHLGYVLGPRMNAGGRVGKGILGSQLLASDDYRHALQIALELEQLNEERRAIESITLEEAIEQIELHKLYEKPIIMVCGKGWHQGILGIIASRLKERYNKPTLVISEEEGIGKGSARSIPGLDIGTKFANAKAKDLLITGGGHMMAAGFSLQMEKLTAFYDYLCSDLSLEDECYEKVLQLDIDASLELAAVNGNLVQIISQAAPFGSGNSQPRFVICDVVLVEARVVGRSHIMAIVADKRVNNGIAKTLKCMLFKGAETDLGTFLLNGIGKRISIAGTIQAHYLDAAKADFILDDVYAEEK